MHPKLQSLSGVKYGAGQDGHGVFRYKYPLLMQASLSRRDSTFGTNDDFGCNDDIPVGPRGYTVGSRETTRQRLETSSSSYYTPQLARRFDFLQSSCNIKKQ
jgi:hypothetical protein